MGSFRISGIKLTLDESEETLINKVSSALGISRNKILALEIVRKAIDARRNKPPHFVYVIKINITEDTKIIREFNNGIQLEEVEDKLPLPSLTSLSASVCASTPIVVAGSGPAGLFAAYLLTQRGLPVLLLERGTPIEQRVKEVQAFWEKGILKPSGNVLFGEGGAGTFSDGKLTSRSKNPYSAWVKTILVEMGAPDSILTDAKPHIGTDRLRAVIVNLRNALITQGCIIRFAAQITDFVIRQGSLEAVIVNESEEIRAGQMVLAIGQSADDTYRALHDKGVRMTAKPFAMGVRVEHPQELINSIQYGKWFRHQKLPSAEYFITAAIPRLNRSVYTFCMCPGGSIIGSSAFSGFLSVNGMSNFQRDGIYANSAIVVNVRTDDFAKDSEPLCGLDFREYWESQAFVLGGNSYYAPAQKLTDFLEDKHKEAVGQTSYHPGVTPALLRRTLPGFVSEALKCGIHEFNRKMPGFITSEANLIGVETRTSSPVRISRRVDGQSETVLGLYPCGEGAGYAGGIISSALDGIKAAENLIFNL